VRISIIIPVLDEAPLIVAALTRLQPLRAQGHQVIVVDGGSADGTAALSGGLADYTIQAPRGRAAQMKAGAGVAAGEAFLFLHADTLLPKNAAELVIAALAKRSWGRFDVRIDSSHRFLAVVGFMMNLRSRVTGIATGDQAIFVSRAAFTACGGFPLIPLMEDVALSVKLRQGGAPACLRARVVTSGRRWEKRGVVTTVVLMWRLRLAYFLGADPAGLAKAYAR